MAEHDNDPATLRDSESGELVEVDFDPFTMEIAKQGFAIVDNYPANHRLRAEALAKEGKAEDPAGHISPELIEETAERLAAEAKDADAAERAARQDKPSMSWNRDRLVEHATGLGLMVEGDANKAAILDAINAATPAS